MQEYNRALDYTVLALNELRTGSPAVAARLLATAVEQPDIKRAIATLEASNRYAFSLTAGRRQIRSAAEFPFKMESDFEGDDPEFDEPVEADLDEDADPLDEVGDGLGDDSDEAPAAAMARVLSSMKRR